MGIYKPKNGDYIDSSGIMHDGEELNTFLNRVNDYSNEEVEVGTWFGEKLYRKVVYVASLDCSSAGFQYIAHNIENLKKVVECGYVFDQTDDYNCCTYNSVITAIAFNSTNIRMYVNKWSKINNWYFTLLYTKTQD